MEYVSSGWLDGPKCYQRTNYTNYSITACGYCQYLLGPTSYFWAKLT